MCGLTETWAAAVQIPPYDLPTHQTPLPQTPQTPKTTVADLYFGKSFWAMVTSACLAFVAFIGAARASSKVRPSVLAPLYLCPCICVCMPVSVCLRRLHRRRARLLQGMSVRVPVTVLLFFGGRVCLCLCACPPAPLLSSTQQNNHPNPLTPPPPTTQPQERRAESSAYAKRNARAHQLEDDEYKGGEEDEDGLRAVAVNP